MYADIFTAVHCAEEIKREKRKEITNEYSLNTSSLHKNLWNEVKNLFKKQPVQPCKEFLDMVKNHPSEGAKALGNNFDNLKCFNKKEPYSEAFKVAVKQNVQAGAYSMEEYKELHSIFDKALDHGDIRNYLEMESILGRPCCYKVIGDSQHNDSTDH
jgi:hypothetical protein